MSNYAKVENGIVTNVIVAEQDFIDTLPDKSSWIKTSYNTCKGVHLGGGIPLRGNFAGIGYTYDSKNDVFIPTKDFPSWVLNKKTWVWDAPVPYPTDGKAYDWDESAVNWVEVSA